MLLSDSLWDLNLDFNWGVFYLFPHLDDIFLLSSGSTAFYTPFPLKQIVNCDVVLAKAAWFYINWKHHTYKLTVVSLSFSP